MLVGMCSPKPGVKVANGNVRGTKRERMEADPDRSRKIERKTASKREVEWMKRVELACA